MLKLISLESPTGRFDESGLRLLEACSVLSRYVKLVRPTSSVRADECLREFLCAKFELEAKFASAWSERAFGHEGPAHVESARCVLSRFLRRNLHSPESCTTREESFA